MVQWWWLLVVGWGSAALGFLTASIMVGTDVDDDIDEVLDEQRRAEWDGRGPRDYADW
jgi:hypothetical protein